LGIVIKHNHIFARAQIGSVLSHYFAIIIIEAVLSSIHPTITNSVRALPGRLKAIVDPYIDPEFITKMRELGFGLPDDLIYFLFTWITFLSDVDHFRQQAKSIPSLAKYDLFNQHLPEQILLLRQLYSDSRMDR